jgi:hypothetical protein
MNIIATVKLATEIAPYKYSTKRVSRVFSCDRSINDVLSWAKSTLNQENVSIGDIEFSEYTGASM